MSLAAGYCAACHYRWQVPAQPSAQPDPTALAQQLAALQASIATQQQHATQWEAHLENLRKEVAAVEDTAEMHSFGVYEPRFGLENAAAYGKQLTKVRAKQKSLIKGGKATECDTPWRVDGSLQEGKKATDRMAKLMLRGFNGECDAAIGSVRYDNVEKLCARITKSCEAINKLGHSQRVMVTRPYYELKLDELQLVHEHRQAVQDEKEREREVKRAMAEEQRAEKEIEKARVTAEKEEASREKALATAKAQLESAGGAQLEKLTALVSKLETELGAAIDRKAKAIARAQLTRSGHVYVLSNIGSFGEDLYKIGMTRRLEPQDRVHELGDASVPFRFDVHAMIYTEDAPALEAALHKRFDSRRVNKVNTRREYFRVTLEEIMEAVRDLHAEVTFVKSPNAEEYRQTRALEAAQ